MTCNSYTITMNNNSGNNKKAEYSVLVSVAYF